MKTLLAFSLASGMIWGGTISYTSKTLFDSSSTVTYTEVVGPRTGVPPVVQESSIDCTTLSLSGCTLGSFSSFFEQVQIPDGKHLFSAQLQIIFSGAGLTSSGLFLQSVTPIDPNLPFSAGTAGTHGFEVNVNFAMAPIYALWSTDGYTLGGASPLFDYTSEVQSALDNNNGELDPIFVTERLVYNFKTAQSAYGGINSITAFSNVLSLHGGEMDTILKVNYSNPEPSVAVLSVTGLLALLLLRLWTRNPHGSSV